MGCAQHALLLQPPAAAVEAASAIKSLCLPTFPPPFCTHPVRQHPFARMRARVRHAKFPCYQQLLLLLLLYPPLRSVSGKLHDNNNTTSVFFGRGQHRGRGGVACRTSKCHEKCMSCCCCRCCCSSKCRQRLIISNWVNGSSISSASGSVLCAGGVGVAPCVR